MSYIGSRPANKPVTVNDITDDAISLAKMAGGTDGNIISYDASGNPVAIATGNDGQVLTSTGAGSPPAFEAVSAGTALTGSTNNQVTTVTGANAIVGEANLLFDGNEMTVQGTPVVVGTNSSSVLDLKNTNSSADGRAVGISFSTNTGGSANAHITAVQDSNAKGKLNFGGYDGTSTRNIVMSVDAGTGAVTKPLQPVFLVRPTADLTNMGTGNTTVSWDGEIFDVGGNFANHTFTAPVTGKYQFNVSFYLTNLDVDTSLFDVNMIASNRIQRLMAINIAKDFTADSNNFHSMNASTILDMDANDTITVRVSITGGGSVIDLGGTAPASEFYTSWSGVLIC